MRVDVDGVHAASVKRTRASARINAARRRGIVRHRVVNLALDAHGFEFSTRFVVRCHSIVPSSQLPFRVTHPKARPAPHCYYRNGGHSTQ